jgi:hypothetical protein
MLHEFLTTNRKELISRCLRKASKRDAPRNTPIVALISEPNHGVPLFLDQLGEALRTEEANPAAKGKGTSGSSSASLAESKRTAALHGKALLDEGYTVDQVVHGYGDVCQAITELAGELKATVTVEEFHTLNRMLDNAIADAVSSYGKHRDLGGEQGQQKKNSTLGIELHSHLDAALKAVEVLMSGQIGIKGATGILLKTSLESLNDLIDKSFPESRQASATTKQVTSIARSKPLG